MDSATPLSEVKVDPDVQMEPDESWIAPETES